MTTTDKVIRIALSTIFQEEQLDSVLEIVNSSRNAEIATLTLLGKYEAPIVMNHCEDNKFREINRELISYDKYAEEVTYSYNRVNSSEAWFPKLLPIENRCKENKLETKKYYTSEIAEELNITEEEFKDKYIKTSFIIDVREEKSNNTMSLSDWQEKQFEPVELQ